MTSSDDGAASEQERLLRDFLGFSLGAPMLFAPPEYAKGSSTREPPDLVWMTQDMLLLMNMQSSTSSQEKQDKHNFTQLRGWLRAWASSPLTLEGDTPLGRVAFAWGERPVALLSVTAAKYTWAEVRYDIIPKTHQASQHVVICCTFPAEALMHLVRMGGSAVDLAHLIERVAQENRRVPLDELQAWMQVEVEASIETLILKYGPGPHFEDDFIDSYAFETIQGLRAMTSASAASENSKGALEAATVFNDLTWAQGAEATWTFNAMANIVKSTAYTDEVATCSGKALLLGRHWLYFAACNASAPGATSALAAAIPPDPNHAGKPMMALVSMIHCGPVSIQSEVAMLMGHPPSTGTQTLEALIRARGYRPS
jgi:hypothetical protein